MEVEGGEEFTVRDYQHQLMKIAIKQNTIIFLPTGAGKTYIAILVLKHLSAPLEKPYNEGGKISIILVNTVALVDQHLKTLRLRTHFKVGGFSGDMNVDDWSKSDWLREFNKNQILVMTCQILVNLFKSSYLDLNKVNILIFDECHHGVKDQPMRQVMKSFENLIEQPRVIGLTATLLNGNCKPSSVRNEIEALETTYHSKIAAVEIPYQIVGYATNPREKIVMCRALKDIKVLEIAKEHLNSLLEVMSVIKVEGRDVVSVKDMSLKPLDPEDGLKQISNLIKDATIHLDMLGVFGGIKAIIAYMIQLERIKKHCREQKMFDIFNSMITVFEFVKFQLQMEMENCPVTEQIFKYSSDKIIVLIEILREYQRSSKRDLCGLIFVDRRFTAKSLYYVLLSLAKLPEFSYLKPEFIVGYNNNPFNSRESLYMTKQNKKIISEFSDKKINLLVATNVLEEGIDIPDCTLVVKFDKPLNYRSYVQSKGRARHEDSFYYIMVQDNEAEKFRHVHNQSKEVQQILNKLLVGQNDLRTGPSNSAIMDMYNELEMEPYFVSGPGSAYVDLLSSVSLLSQYCQCIPGDKYTQYAPEWYLRRDNNESISVVIELPLKCSIKEKIEGPVMKDRKTAKRAAALEACKKLHQIGELDDDLKPRNRSVPEQDTEFLFVSWPSEKDPGAGTKNKNRNHIRHVPNICKGQLKAGQPIYLHVINMTPKFSAVDDFSLSVMIELYESNLCFGILSPKPLPKLCEFPVFVTAGEILVNIVTNGNVVHLRDEQLHLARRFHTLIFNDVLEILKMYLVFDNKADAEMLVLVPINKDSMDINFEVLEEQMTVKPIEELTRQQRLDLIVDVESYDKKIVIPWYRTIPTNYVVTRICDELNSNEKFPSHDFKTFKSYYKEKYRQTILNPEQPLLLVKGLSKHLNCIKPRGTSGKRKRELSHEEIDEHLIPELCVKQEFPGSLWVQANLIPTILYRVTCLLQADQLRSTIIREINLGSPTLSTNENWLALKLDHHLLKNYKFNRKEENALEQNNVVDDSQLAIESTSTVLPNLNQDFTTKILESQFPWKDIEEPKDVERDLRVNGLDIEYYESFISYSVTQKERLMKNESPIKQKLYAITYDKEFEMKPIKLFTPKNNPVGPQLSDIYKALATAKCNDIVNLERLETLGDSFLKYSVSLYVLLKFPNYDEGQATTLKCKIISNRNLFYLGRERDIGGYIKEADFVPNGQWLIPSFTVPDSIRERILNKEISIRSLYNFDIGIDEQVNGILSEETERAVKEEDFPMDENEEGDHSTLCNYLNIKYIGDKIIADCVEALLGVFFESNGLLGGVRFLEWMKIIPPSENLLNLMRCPSPNPILNENARAEEIDFHLPNWKTIEDRLGYHFNNRAYLLQALTHSSYSPNRVTDSYERLEFLGDAVLDFLITCYIYEYCGNLNPGEITDLRSALVNNCTFASYTVKYGFHKFLLLINSLLAGYIDKFAEFQENRDYVIDEQVLILLQENDMHLAEHIDVPKVLGDVFEALAGAVYLDCGKDLNIVWKVFYKLMWFEIDSFSRKVPKNTVRELYEKTGAYPKFYPPVEVLDGSNIMVKLEFMLNGARKVVHGFGINKTLAKKAAAKIALRLLCS